MMNAVKAFSLRQWYFWWFVWARFYKDGCSARAAALAYTSLLSLVPLMAVGFSILAAFPRFASIAQATQDLIFKHFVASSGAVVQTYLQLFVAQATQLSFLGFTGLFISAILMMFTMEQALNHIWRVHHARHGVAAFLMYWAVLTITPLFMGASVIVSSYIASLSFFNQTQLPHSGLLLNLTPYLLSSVAFSIFYIAVPNRRVPMQYGILSGLLAAFLFEWAKRGFAMYIAHFKTYQLLYGALSVLPIFLVWIYVCWLVVLFCAEFSYALTYGYYRMSQQKLDPFIQLYRWLGYLRAAQQHGQALNLEYLVRVDGRVSEIPPEEQLRLLLEKRLVQSVSGGRIVLARDLSSFTLLEFAKLIPWRLPECAQLNMFDDCWENSLRQALLTIEYQNHQALTVPMVDFYVNRSNDRVNNVSKVE